MPLNYSLYTFNSVSKKLKPDSSLDIIKWVVKLIRQFLKNFYFLIYRNTHNLYNDLAWNYMINILNIKILTGLIQNLIDRCIKIIIYNFLF